MGVALIRQQTLIIAGTDDPIVPVVNAKVMHRLLPHSPLYLHPGGHIDLIANRLSSARSSNPSAPATTTTRTDPPVGQNAHRPIGETVSSATASLAVARRATHTNALSPVMSRPTRRVQHAIDCATPLTAIRCRTNNQKQTAVAYLPLCSPQEWPNRCRGGLGAGDDLDGGCRRMVRATWNHA